MKKHALLLFCLIVLAVTGIAYIIGGAEFFRSASLRFRSASLC